MGCSKFAAHAEQLPHRAGCTFAFTSAKMLPSYRTSLGIFYLTQLLLNYFLFFFFT